MGLHHGDSHNIEIVQLDHVACTWLGGHMTFIMFDLINACKVGVSITINLHGITRVDDSALFIGALQVMNDALAIKSVTSSMRLSVMGGLVDSICNIRPSMCNLPTLKSVTSGVAPK
jgi:hypothetical protein